MVIRSTLAMLAIACSVTGAASAQTPRDASPTTAAGAITGVVLSDDRTSQAAPPCPRTARWFRDVHRPRDRDERRRYVRV